MSAFPAKHAPLAPSATTTNLDFASQRYTMATRLRWLGHSCLWVESDGQKLLFDPFVTGNPKAAAKPDELTPDFILVSHGHSDHVGDTVAIAQRSGATI